MADDASDKPGGGGKKKGLIGRMTPKGGTRQVMGVILLLTIVAVAVAALVFGFERSRANYLEQRNLRELDRVAANIGSTSQTLGTIASLYFNPRQLHFSLTPATECLMASTRIQRTADLAIDINYYFVDSGPASIAPRGDSKPPESKPSPDGKDAAPPAAPPAAAAAPAAPPATLCPYDAPVRGVQPGETLAIDGERIRLGEWLLLRDLLRPMTAGAGADAAAQARQAIESEARRIERGGFGPAPGGTVPEVVTRSLRTAFDRNAVRTEVSVSTSALDLDTSLETFDAIQIIGAGEGAAPALLFQAGQLPAAVTGTDTGASRDFLNAILKASDQSEPVVASKGQRAYQESEGAGSLLMESRVYPAGDLMIFDKRYASLGGFACSAAKPCRIIGIIKDKRFGNSVRRFEGMHSTAFLIAVMTLIGLLPMIHLALRKRLDAIGRRIQYVMWFSLTLLAGSAVIASLTVWAGAISKSRSSDYALEEVARIKSGFARELSSSLRLVTQIGAGLKTDQPGFPAPRAVHWVNGVPPAGRDAMLLDTTGFFRGDGYAARDVARFHDVRNPPFGTNVADRSYFLRAQGGDVHSIDLGKGACHGRKGALKFTIDRVVARPDGVAKTVLALPAQPGCVDPPGRGTGVGTEDPARPQVLIASGYLQTFIAASLQPGFQYAVIDPDRPEGDPDILFSSRRSAELAEKFERDLDDAEGFRTRMEQFRLTDGTDRIRRLATHYRGDPVRLTMTRLHPSVDWVLVVMEGRNDSGFAIWRAATFGYSSWLFTIVLVFSITGIVRAWNHKALDRRPGLWLWPFDVASDFTPARFAWEYDHRARLQAAVLRRDLHLRRIFIAGLVGLVAAEGASRTLLALGVVMAAFAARAYFKGKTASDEPAARKLDRFFIYLAAILFLLSLALFVTTAWLAPSTGDSIAGQALRIALFLGALPFLAGPLADALGAVAEPTSRGARAAAWINGRLPTLVTGEDRPGEAKTRIGWMYFLLAIGALPAAGGYLDSIDHDSALVAERQAHIAARAAEDRTRALDSIEVGRLPVSRLNPVEARLERRIVAGALPGADMPAASAAQERSKRRPWDNTIADLSMRSLDLHETALSFSDFQPWHMRDGFGAALRSPWANVVVGIAAMLLPFLILYGAFVLFRRQYFTAAPRTPAIDPADFATPLTAARSSFLAALLVPAAKGVKAALPFDKDPSQRHLILGVDMDIRSEPVLDPVRDGIAWIDLLDAAASNAPPDKFPARIKAVVIGNLDIALQLPDRAQVKKVFDAVEAAIEAANLGANPRRHLFILSDVVPLDRITLLRDREGIEDAPTRIDDWRWAALLQDFTLVAVVPTAPDPATSKGAAKPSCAERELRVINTVFARALLTQLETSMQPPKDPEKLREYEDRVIDYVAEQMADYYHKLWAASSDEERVLLYHIAWRCHLKMTEGPAVRSLLVRGLIVRSPEYRLMNKSFARYVRRIERIERIRKRAADVDGVDKTWPLIRVPLIVFTLALLVIVQLVSPRHATGALGIVPALGAILPAMLANWLRLKATEG